MVHVDSLIITAFNRCVPLHNMINYGNHEQVVLIWNKE